MTQKVTLTNFEARYSSKRPVVKSSKKEPQPIGSLERIQDSSTEEVLYMLVVLPLRLALRVALRIALRVALRIALRVALRCVHVFFVFMCAETMVGCSCGCAKEREESCCCCFLLLPFLFCSRQCVPLLIPISKSVLPNMGQLLFCKSF